MLVAIFLCKLAVCITTVPMCQTEDELYSQFAPDCVPTCSDPYPTCSGLTQEGCLCPIGTVLDQIQNKCVPLNKCSKNIITNHKIIVKSSIQ